MVSSDTIVQVPYLQSEFWYLIFVDLGPASTAHCAALQVVASDGGATVLCGRLPCHLAVVSKYIRHNWGIWWSWHIWGKK